ncbi:MAG: rhomboid family intramembrane serine protease [Thermomicrobiales bacterium]
MIPIGDENAGQVTTPVANWTLIGINIIVFLYELAVGPRGLDALFFNYGAVPANISQFHNLYTLLTSMFLHGGLAHIGGNMLFLFVFGDNIEDAMGHISYVLFYLLCGIAAAVAQVLLDPTSTIPMVGASGAISGVMGAYLVLFPRGNVRAAVLLPYFWQVLLVPSWVMIGIWFLMQLISGIGSLGAGADSGGVAFWAHVGGFIAGTLLVWIFRDKDAVARQNAVRADQIAWRRAPARSGNRRGPN